MAHDSSLAVRRAILARLKAEAPLTALVPAAFIYPGSVPADHGWPFIRWGSPTGVPIRASCFDGMDITVALTAFAKPRYQNNDPRLAMLETAEDRAHKIGAAMAKALDRTRLILDTDYDASAVVTWRNTQTFADRAEKDAWQTVQNFRVRVIS